MTLAGYILSRVAGRYALSRLTTRGQDRLIAHAADTADGAVAMARALLDDVGCAPTDEDAQAFAEAFFVEVMAAQRAGVRTLRASVVEDWIVARHKAAKGPVAA